MRKRRRFRPPHRNGPRFLLVMNFFVTAFFDMLWPVKRIESPNPEIDPEKIQVFMVGHATMLINFYGTTILTDPVFGHWLPFPRRKVGPGFKIEQMPKIDLILQSHMHWDHFHVRSVRKLASDTTSVVLPKECADLVRGMQFKEVKELHEGDVAEFLGLKITTYKPHHWGQRVPWEKMQRGYNAYVIEKNGKSIFFCGDSGHGPVFQEVAKNHTVDIALLPIGAYTPTTFRKVHMNPEDALKAKAELGATAMIPFHFGTFRLAQEPMFEPADWLDDIVTEEGIEGVSILLNGDSYEH